MKIIKQALCVITFINRAEFCIVVGDHKTASSKSGHRPSISICGKGFRTISYKFSNYNREHVEFTKQQKYLCFLGICMIARVIMKEIHVRMVIPWNA